jgi:plastocyanin
MNLNFDRLLSRTVMALSAAALGVGVLATVAGAEEGATGSITGEVTVKGNPKNRVGVVVSLEKVAGTFRPPAKQAEMDQQGMKFIPHVMAVLKGTTVKFNNHDNVRHNVMSPDGDEGNLGTWGQGENKTFTFKTPGVYHQLCNVHPEMGAAIAAT